MVWFLALHLDVVGFDGGEALHHLQHIGVVAQKVFVLLGGGVGDLRKGSEGGHIEEGLPVEPPHVMGAGHPGDGGDRQVGEAVQGKVQVFGKVVGGAHRDVPQQGGLGQAGGAGHGLAEGAVSPGHHHPVEVAAPADDGLAGVPPVLGGVGGDETVLLGHSVDDVRQTGPGLVFSRMAVIDKKDALHLVSPPYGKLGHRPSPPPARGQGQRDIPHYKPSDFR